MSTRFIAVTLALLAGSVTVRAQEFIPLLTFTNTWRYNQGGADLGANWVTPGYDDSAWPQGLPLFGVESNWPFPYRGNGFTNAATPLLLTAPGSNTQTVTYYFRTRFHYPGTNTVGAVLTAQCHVDDGCVIHLNGVDVGRIRVATNQNWQTLAGVNFEGFLEVTNLNLAPLVPGENVLAVEVHQNSLTSSDVIFGLALHARVPQPLNIVEQPQSQTRELGEGTIFNVGVTGTPVFFQWLKNGAVINGATQSTHVIATNGLSHAGDYSVVVSNASTVLTSAVATLTLVPGVSGPRVNWASVSLLGSTNQISIEFDRKLVAQTVNIGPTTSNNFRVRVAGTTQYLPVENVFYSIGLASRPESYAVVRVGGPLWYIQGFSNYVAEVRNVQSTAGIAVAPGTEVPVYWDYLVPSLSSNATWLVHAAAATDPGIYLENWMDRDYVPGGAWMQAPGPWGSTNSDSVCSGPLRTLIPYQPEPILARTHFNWPEGFPPRGRLRLDFGYEDGLILYCNGLEIYRAAIDSGQVSGFTRANASYSVSVCASTSVTVTNLVPGPNVLAAAVVQSGADTNTDVAFRLGLSVETTIRGLPTPAPVLEAVQLDPGQVRLSWAGAGFVLESATNLPAGPWQVISNATSPFTNPIVPPRQFFRLRQ